MKLYTRPRSLYVWQLQPGDQIATQKKGGGLFHSVTAYVDADLVNNVKWAVVHNLVGLPIPKLDNPAVMIEGTRVAHTFGEHDRPNHVLVIAREVIEIDPWSYVQRDK